MSQKKKSVLFLCLGNICRSTMAEIVMNHIVQKNGTQDEWIIDSAGTGGWHAGDPPDHRTIEVCKKNLGKECPPITHRGRKITQDDYYKFDYILGMDDSNISNAKSIAPKDATAIVDYLGRFDPEKVLIIEDPYYGGIKEFYEVYEQVYRSCENFYKIHQNS